MADADLLLLRDQLYTLAQAVCAAVSLGTVDGPADLQLSAEREEAEERAAILEFDGGSATPEHRVVPKSTAHPLLRRLGQRIKAARTARGLSQEALADAAGVDRSYMSGVERGVRNLTVLKLAAIARALRTESRELLPDP